MNRLTKTALLMLTVLILAGIFYGCGKRPETIESEFTEMITVEKVAPDNMTEAAEYMNKYLRKLNQERASQMLIAYEEFIARYINTDSDATQVQSLLPFADEKTKSISGEKIRKDEKAENYFGLLTDAYIGVGLAEGKIVLQPDYEALEKEFGKEILPAVDQLYSIRAKICRLPATENATLQISYEELLQRARSVEELIAENKKEPLIQEDAKWLYSSYLNIILMGTTNSPVFNYETGQFSEDAREVYSRFAEENPEMALTWAIGEYFRYLDSIDYTMNYKDSEMSKAFFDNCARIASETEKRVYE